jgi:hypothetical protein
VMPYQNVSYQKQKEALASLDQNLWETQHWLIKPELISRFENEGHLDLFANLQKAALYRILNQERLNTMLSTQLTLMGEGLEASALISSLANSIVLSKKQPDLLERLLQIAFIERSNELIADEKTHSDVRAALNQTNSEIERWLGKQKNTSSETLKNHFRFALSMLEKE